VRIDLERYQSQGGERPGLHDWHVIGGHDCGAREIGSGARSKIGHSVPYQAAQQFHQLEIFKGFQEAKGIAPSTEDDLTMRQLLPRISRLVKRIESVAEALEACANPGSIFRAVGEGVGDESDPASTPQEVAQLREGILQVLTSVDPGGAE
jgi:hypothetical protein